MGIIGRVLGKARRSTGTSSPARTGRTGRRGTPARGGTGRGGGMISRLLRR